MFRLLSGNTSKNIPIYKAGEALTRGMAVVMDYTNDTVKKATTTGECFFVDVPMNFDGMNAVITPTDSAFEKITAGADILLVPTYLGEEYAITEVAAGLTQGDSLKAVAGSFVKAVTSDVSVWVYGGKYSDPTGLAMHVVKRVPAKTV